MDLAQKVWDIEGKIPLTKDDKELTIRSCCIEALLAVYQNEETSGEEKLQRYQLAKKLWATNAPKLKVEEKALIKRLVGKLWGPLIVGQVYDQIDPDEKPKLEQVT